MCGSEGKRSQAFVEGLGAKYVEVRQRRFTTNSGGDDFLRMKFNDSLQTHGTDYDWYCLVGADDFVSLDFFSTLPITKVPTICGVDMGCPLILHHLDYKIEVSVALQYSQPYRLLPGVNAFNRPAMMVSGWKPYQWKGCETGAEMYIAHKGQVWPISGYVVMLKEQGCLNSFGKVFDRHQVSAMNEATTDILNDVLAKT